MVKKTLTSPLTMIAPQPEKPLLLYLTSTPRSIGALLVQDIDGIEKPVYYISRKVNGAESRYTPFERHCLALIFTMQKLRHYFLAHSIQVVTWSDPAIKSQVLTDLLAQFPSGEHELVEVPLPGEVHVSVAAIETYWDFKFDGASGAGKGGAGVTLTSQEGEKFHLSYKLDFECSNNEAEYEALILGLIVAQKKGLLQRLLTQFDDVQIQHTPRTHNRFLDALATLEVKVVEIPDDSIAIVIEKRITPAVLADEHAERDAEGWKADIIQQLKTGQGIIKPAELA
ncbi:uncharacterized protein LOC114289665 [Camellia sinensis]|uniref:uncharacterized protein LOC114289665 n=1 Tax=Camellia sinensis TaxID=4442 RepID=UPI001035D678|nr:uncharacterized protein LOC114289665 [Camellia sinensis]